MQPADGVDKTWGWAKVDRRTKSCRCSQRFCCRNQRSTNRSRRLHWCRALSSGSCTRARRTGNRTLLAWWAKLDVIAVKDVPSPYGSAAVPTAGLSRCTRTSIGESTRTKIRSIANSSPRVLDLSPLDRVRGRALLSGACLVPHVWKIVEAWTRGKS